MAQNLKGVCDCCRFVIHKVILIVIILIYKLIGTNLIHGYILKEQPIDL